MYLARQQINRKTHYFIRQSIAGAGCMQSRDLFDLGTDPKRFIIYPGGNSYFFDPGIEESLRCQGLEIGQDDLDAIFFEFLNPETQRVIAAFDRGPRHWQTPTATDMYAAPHDFDKRRYHYLRFGRRTIQHIKHVPEKIFRPLLNKSRDEIEQYFLTAERILRLGEHPDYVSAIFELKRFAPDPHAELPLIVQRDAFFIDCLCQLNNDPHFKAGLPEFSGLHEYLVKYAIIYFDSETPTHPWDYDYIKAFINRHRVYTPPSKVRIKIREAEALFGHSWKELQRMDRSALSRIYRHRALKHHPDQGGQSETFQRLTAYYRILSSKK